MNGDMLSYLFDGANWAFGDPDAFPARIFEHLEYTGWSLLIAFVIAFPIGLLVGHTNRGAFLAINLGNAGRSLPSLGVLMLVIALLGIGLTPVIVALVLLAIPPILTATYAGVRAVAGATVDAARGIGMTESQIVMQVELPNALPIIIGGLRNAALQVISTATIAAYVGQGGLGRFLFDGLALRDYPRVVGGAVLLAVLAVVVDLLLGLVERLIVSPGVDGRAARRTGRKPSAESNIGPADSLPHPA